MKKIHKFFYQRAINTLIVFVALVVFFSLFTTRHVFLNPRNLTMLGRSIPDLGIVALGVGMLMICGEFDLSVSSVLPMCAFIFISLLKVKMNPALAFFLVLGSGALFGFLNGIITVKGRIPSFITTLGTMMFWRGILYVTSKMMPIGLRAYLPAGSLFEHAFIGRLGGLIPMQIVWFIVVGIILGLILHFNRFGNWVYATGDNELAAKAMGIPTGRVKITCFVIVSILCAFVGVMQLLRLETFACTQGEGFELRAIAASVVGGTFLGGGIGSMPGIFLGALTIHILENGLILMRVPVFGISAFIGSAIILFVILNTYIERRRLG